MKFGLTDITINKLRTVFEKYPNITKVIIYGSRAMGNFKKGSDIDLTMSGKDLNLTIMNKIADEIDGLLLPYFVDLSIYEKISNADLIDHIRRKGKTFYSR